MNNKKETCRIKQWQGKQTLRVDLAVLHHIPLLGPSLLLFSLLFSFS